MSGSDFLVNAIFLCIGLALALAGTFVASTLQHRSWRYQFYQKDEDERVRAANETVQEISRVLDKRLYRQRRLLWALKSKDDVRIDKARGHYEEALFEWNENLGGLKARLWVAFDREEMATFEESIYSEFASIGRDIEVMIKHGHSAKISAKCEKRLNFLSYQCFVFVNQMLHRVDRREIRGLGNRFRLSEDNWDNLDSSYLLKRLFGLIE